MDKTLFRFSYKKKHDTLKDSNIWAKSCQYLRSDTVCAMVQCTHKSKQGKPNTAERLDNMTRQEANRILDYAKRNGCHYKRGHCCYQEDNVSRFDMVEIGTNHGVYGWNWTLYFNPKNETYYLSCYRTEIERHENATISIVEEFHSPYAPDYYKTLTTFENKNGVITERKYESQ